MRFDSPEHVQAWKASGAYPRIHAPIFEAAVTEMLPPPESAGPVLDLCSSTGLMGAHLRQLGYEVYWAEPDTKAYQLGLQHGAITSRDRLFTPPIEDRTLAAFAGWVADAGIRWVVARRCFPELSLHMDLTAFVVALADAGVQGIAVEGQKMNARSTHPFGHGETQARVLAESGRWTITWSRPPHLYIAASI